MSDEDIEAAHQDWNAIKRILQDGVKLTKGKDGRTYNDFPGPRVARIIHLRPHGNHAYYTDFDGTSWGNGKISDSVLLPVRKRRMTRQSYWLKNSFVRKIVQDMVDKN